MYPRTFVLLQQEGHLIQGCLTHGLTSLRRARVDKKGDVYASFIHLSIGFERLMKVALIINHMARNQFSPPSAEAMKKYGHKLPVLLEELRKISLADSVRSLDDIDEASVEWEMFTYLSDFASSTRYFNLDELGAGKTVADPLAHWRTIIRRIVKEDVSTKRVKKTMGQAAHLSQQMAGSVIVLAHDAEGKPMDVLNAIGQPMLDELAAPYAVWYMVSLLKKLEKSLREINDFADAEAHRQGRTDQPVPSMSEFFLFLYYDRAECLRKKVWP
jgi:hypothetical protein